MKQSELNHLRRLLAWVRCEIGQDPQEMVTMLADMAHKLGNPPIDEAAQRRLVEGHDAARRVPAYVREAVKALAKVTGPGEDIGDAEPSLRKIACDPAESIGTPIGGPASGDERPCTM